MKVQTYWLTLDYGDGNEFTFFGLSRVAVKRYWSYYKGKCAMKYGPDYIKTRA